MKIAVWHNLPSGGAKRALYNQTKELLARGHEIECWTLVCSTESYLPMSSLVPVHVIDYPQPFSLMHKYMPKLLDLFQKGFCSITSLKSISRRCARQINNGGFDILFSANCKYQAAPPIARYTDLSSVLYSQEPYRKFYEPGLCEPWIQLNDPKIRMPKTTRPVFHAKKRMTEELRNVRAFDKVLANSEYSRNKMNKVYGIETEVCYMGIDTDFFRNTGEEREYFLLGVGAIQPHKRIDLAIAAVSMLTQPRPVLLWIGNMSSPAYTGYLRKLAASLNVDFRPLVMASDSELLSYMSRATLMIHTAKFEPFGLAPLEASACGTPVVAIAEGGARETIKPGINGLLVESTEPQAFADTLQSLLKDRPLIRQMSMNAPAYVAENWSWTKSVDQLEKILQNSLQTHH